ncbi:hypothetical protein ACH5RR_024084 [Cinchona calisaya]|uniref:Uncharacterized protein n=1 Tax=Cinchona calisaya TaxID=153742 RepID=A0ABD2ZCG4_9GENT
MLRSTLKVGVQFTETDRHFNWAQISLRLALYGVRLLCSGIIAVLKAQCVDRDFHRLLFFDNPRDFQCIPCEQMIHLFEHFIFCFIIAQGQFAELYKPRQPNINLPNLNWKKGKN